jgi:hypothetical protein
MVAPLWKSRRFSESHSPDRGASKSEFLSMTWAELPELGHDSHSLTELPKLAPFVAPLTSP